MHSLDDLRKEAKFWLEKIRERHSGFTKRFRLAYPGAPPEPVLRDVEHALARELGYDNWKALTAARQTPVPPSPPADLADPASSFLGFACWDHHIHGQGDYRSIEAAAMRLLGAHPEIPSASLSTAVACGDLALVDRLTAERPALVNQKGGVREWEPLLYLCYARLPLDAVRSNSIPMARLLLDRGANANAYYMAGHSVYGTLVGVVGEGEQDAPPHPGRDALYRLLLERGAEPYDDQVLYNTHFHGNVLWWLKLTWEHSLASGHAGDWRDPDLPIFDMGGYGTGAGFLFWVAEEHDKPELRQWLLERGANPRSTRRTLENRRPPAPLFAAARRNDVAAMARLLDQGVALNGVDAHGSTALHVAAAHNSLDAARLLIERGADVNLRERQFHATPLGFASHHDRRAMIDLLAPSSRDAWCLAGQGKVDRLRTVLAEDPQLARTIAPNGSTLLWWLPDDEDLALDVVEVLLAHGVNPSITAKDGTTAADSARALAMPRVAARLDAAVRR